MRLRSIRWSVFLWYALILIGSLGAIGWALHAEMERTLYRDTDAQIEFWMSTAQHTIKEYSLANAPSHLQESLPPQVIFAVWDQDGKRIIATKKANEQKNPKRNGSLKWDHIRASTRLEADGTCILVGKSVELEHGDTRRFLMVLFLTSGLIIVIALGGGWLLVTKSLSPIDRISAAARRISGQNLGERIDTIDIQNELGQLANTLNDSFDRLEGAIELQTRFTADASHELRTPLAIVLAHLELAKTTDKTEQELLERVDICLDASRRMRSVVEGLLTLARADAGELSLEIAKFEFSTMLEEVRSSLEPFALKRNIAIEHDLQAIIIHGDRERLRELATNLYTNAIHYNNDGGQVIITLTREANQAVFCVEDTGIGIADSDQDRVFERFTRVDQSRSRFQGGSGLGLSIVRSIAELHGGSVELTSEINKGAKFTIRLPLTEQGD